MKTIEYLFIILGFFACMYLAFGREPKKKKPIPPPPIPDPTIDSFTD